MADNLTPSCAVVTKSGNLNFLEPSGPVTGQLFTIHKMPNNAVPSNIHSLSLSLIGQNIFFSNLLLNTLHLCSSLHVRHHVSHPHKMKNYSSAHLNLYVSNAQVDKRPENEYHQTVTL